MRNNWIILRLCQGTNSEVIQGKGKGGRYSLVPVIRSNEKWTALLHKTTNNPVRELNSLYQDCDQDSLTIEQRTTTILQTKSCRKNTCIYLWSGMRWVRSIPHLAERCLWRKIRVYQTKFSYWRDALKAIYVELISSGHTLFFCSEKYRLSWEYCN